MENFIWKIKTFDELSAQELHAVLKARIDVFVVEQNCPYAEIDGDDPKAIHLWAEHNGNVAAYCRIFHPGIKYDESSIGRVLTTQKYRKMNTFLFCAIVGVLVALSQVEGKKVFWFFSLPDNLHFFNNL